MNHVMLKKGSRAIISSLALGMVFFLFSIQAKAALPLKMKLELGLEGQYRIGTWTPLRVLLENQGHSLEGMLVIKLTKRDFLEQKSVETVYSLPISLPSFSRKLYRINVLLESNVHSLEVLFVADGKTLLKREIQLEFFYEKNRFILVVNRTHSGFNFLNPVKTKKIRRVVYADLDKLPSKWIGYDAIQALILDDITSVDLTRSQQQAIKIWLSTGGTLIVTARGGYGKFKSSFLLDLLPLESLEEVHLDSSFSSLQDKYGAFDRDLQKVKLWNTRWREGDILIKEGDIPLVIRLNTNQGRIFFLAFDFFQPPFKDWPGIPHLWAEMLKDESAFPLLPRGILDSIVTRSFSWQGRLYPGRRGVALFLLAYLLSIGFFSWQTVRKKSLQRVGINLVLTTLLFIGISYLSGVKIREKNTSLRQISILYKKQGGSLVRTENYFVLFSPYSQPVELKFDEKNCFVTALLAPGRQRILKDLTIHLREGKIRWSPSFSPPWSFHLFRLETILPFSLQVKINEDKEVIRVSLKNLNSFSLQDLLLMYDGRSFFLRELSPSGEADLTLDLKGEKFSPLIYFQEVMLRSPDPEVELRKKIFQRMWNFDGPLKELTDKFPVLLAWFEESPQSVVVADPQVKLGFTGLLIMPLRVSST